MMLPKYLVVFLLVGSLNLQAAESTPTEWLIRMNAAFTNINYDGIFSYMGGNELSTLRVVHMVVDGEQRERLAHLNGAPREIIRKGDQVACILMPGDELLALESSIPSGPFARSFIRQYDKLTNSYTLNMHGESRQAERDAVRMSIMPTDGDRYGYRLWLDKDTGILLRSELVDSANTKLEIFQFTSLTIGDAVSEQALEPTTAKGKLVSHLVLESEPWAARVAEPGEMHWGAGWLPLGFKMATADIRRTPSNLKMVNTLMYTDGLAAFSVFIEQWPKNGATAMDSRNGATVAVTAMVSGADDAKHLVTVVGEVPVATAKKIARSVHYTP